MIEIKSRWDDTRVIYKSESATTIREAVLEAVGNGVSLSAADLRAANLRAANLSAANLSAANLSAANLRDANLSAADLRAADLRAANLSDANLRAANLSAANLSAADLSDANLSDADLSAADLSDANLSAANLTSFKADLFEVLLNTTPAEVQGLKEKVIAGEIDGTCYKGACACLVGSIANMRGIEVPEYMGDFELPGIKPNGGRAAEVWFYNLSPGCVPETNAVAAITVGWIEEFQNKIAAFVAFGAVS